MKRGIALTVLAGCLLAGSPAHADAVSPKVTKAANAMQCGQRVDASVLGPNNYGVECKVAGKGRFYVLAYDDPGKAIRFWTDWLDTHGEPAYMVRKGRLFVVPIDYEQKAAKYAAKRTGGKVLTFNG